MIKKVAGSDAENWEKVASEYIDFIKKNKDGYLKYMLYGSLFSTILSVVDGIKGKTILDAGCGEGRLCRMLTERGGIVTGCDASQTMISEAQIIENKDKLGIKYFKHDLVLTLPKDNKYDLVVSNLVLFNISDLEKVITNLAKVIKPGGRLIFSLIHPCFNITRSQWFNLRNIGYKGGKITFEINKSYKDQGVYQKDKSFIKGEVNYYHRPIETYAKNLTKNGFFIDAFLEPVLKLNQIYDQNTYHHHYLPRFLIIGSTKVIGAA